MAEEKLNKKQVSVRNHKSKPGKGTYFAGVLGILLLVIMAFLGPQIVFRMQEIYQTGRIRQGTRAGLDMESIYSTYGSLRERMVVLAQRLEEDYEFYVAGTEYHRSAELLDMLDMILNQKGYEKLEECGIAPQMAEVENRGYSIDQIKKYVIYNDIMGNETNAVVVSAWYFEFTTRHDITVKLLIDTETYTLYYMRLNQKDYRKDKESILYWEKLYYVDWFYDIDWMNFWFNYYEAGQTSVQNLEGYLAGLDLGKYVAELERDGAPEKVMGITMDFPYMDQYYLKWQASVTTLPGTVSSFSMGLKDIANLIPELQED